MTNILEMKRCPSHAGEILRNLYMMPANITVSALALRIGVSRKTISKIVNGKGSVTADMALRLSQMFNTSPELWLNLQNKYDLWQAAHMGQEWQQIKPIEQELFV